jgi:hypothetical protein
VSPGPEKFTSGETAMTSAAGTPTSSPLVGRDDEVGALTNALDVALAGRAQILADHRGAGYRKNVSVVTPTANRRTTWSPGSQRHVHQHDRLAAVVAVA